MVTPPKGIEHLFVHMIVIKQTKVKHQNYTERLDYMNFLNKGNKLSFQQIKELPDHTKIYVESVYPKENCFVGIKRGNKIYTSDETDSYWALAADFRELCIGYLYKESVKLNNTEIGIESGKYEVLKTADIIKYCSDEQKEQLGEIVDTILTERLNDGKPKSNTYYVVNTDETWAEEVRKLIEENY